MPYKWLYDFVKTVCLEKICFSSYKPKYSTQIRLQDFIKYIKNYLRNNVHFLYEVRSYLQGLVRHAGACPKFSKITKQQYFWEGLSCFVYMLHLVTHIWKLQSCCFSWVWSGMPKVPWNKLQISLERVEWFHWFFVSSYLDFVRYPL